MTVEQVKALLPDVRVRLEDTMTTHSGHVSGRLNDFAGVWTVVDGREYRAEFAWSTVARAITEGRLLLI